MGNPEVDPGGPEVLLKQLTVPWAQSLVPRTWRDRFVDSTGVLSQVLGEGMSSEKHFSLPERQKYFPASSPLAIVPTLLL
jgi:hypothetical protein